MPKQYLPTICIVALLILPLQTLALQIPLSGNELAEMSGIDAKAYAVMDTDSGEILISKNPDETKIPASLTKIVTALVVLDLKPKLSKVVSMTLGDQKIGQCGNSGVCIKSKAGVKFTLDGLFHASLILSANNAANALARSTGLSSSKFAEKMNEKAAALGATSSHFNEPTGLDPSNTITASDYSKIMAAAFDNPYLSKVAGLEKYNLKSTNNSKYNQTLSNKNTLLADSDLSILGAKTGYLNESGYNFSAVLKYRNGPRLAVVILGKDHLYSAIEETKMLARLSEEARALATINQFTSVLGTSTLLNIY